MLKLSIPDVVVLIIMHLVQHMRDAVADSVMAHESNEHVKGHKPTGGQVAIAMEKSAGLPHQPKRRSQITRALAMTDSHKVLTIVTLTIMSTFCFDHVNLLLRSCQPSAHSNYSTISC